VQVADAKKRLTCGRKPIGGARKAAEMRISGVKDGTSRQTSIEVEEGKGRRREWLAQETRARST
jgi:hypothetical protein